MLRSGKVPYEFVIVQFVFVDEHLMWFSGGLQPTIKTANRRQLADRRTRWNFSIFLSIDNGLVEKSFFYIYNFTFTDIHIELLAFNDDLWTPIYIA